MSQEKRTLRKMIALLTKPDGKETLEKVLTELGMKGTFKGDAKELKTLCRTRLKELNKEVRARE